MSAATLNGGTYSRADVVTLLRVLDAVDYSVNSQEAYGAEEDQIRDLANAADELRELLRRWSERV